jgi:hypothetical protein
MNGPMETVSWFLGEKMGSNQTHIVEVMKILSAKGFILACCLFYDAAASDAASDAASQSLWVTQPTLWELAQGVAITRAIPVADPQSVETRGGSRQSCPNCSAKQKD